MRTSCKESDGRGLTDIMERGVSRKGDRILKYQEFVEKIRKQVEKQAGEDAKVNVNRILKNNLEPIDGLTILRRGDNVSRAIWLNPLYQRYEAEGVPINTIADEILEYHNRSREIGSCDISFYTDFDKVKDHVACKLIHKQLNRQLLQEVPHRDYLDLAVVYYYKVESSVFEHASILIKNEHMDFWETDEEELYRIAMTNTLQIQPYEFMDIMDLICEMTEGSSEHFDRQGIPMYVLTNRDKNFGAANLLFPSVLREVGEKIGEDYYILPSSIHECIVIPVRNRIQPKELHELVAEINREHVAEEELLGDSVYRYYRNYEQVSVVFP